LDEPKEVGFGEEFVEGFGGVVVLEAGLVRDGGEGDAGFEHGFVHGQAEGGAADGTSGAGEGGWGILYGGFGAWGHGGRKN
jgi:hypothetical protein